MAKEQTTCGCGGSFDGTPSGLKKHNQTAKHLGWVSGQQKAASAERRSAAKAAVKTGMLDILNGSASADDVMAAVAAAQADATVSPTETQAEPEVKPGPELGLKARLSAAKAEAAKYRRYVAYAAKLSNNVRPENKLRYEELLSQSEAIVEDLSGQYAAEVVNTKSSPRVGKAVNAATKEPVEGPESLKELLRI